MEKKLKQTTEFNITLKAVYSQTVPIPYEVKLADGWSLSWY